jgi:ABC-type multidrug transport system ATPase subunit
MDEADQNSDVVCIIDKGKIIANGTPEQLKKSLNQDCIQGKPMITVKRIN